MPHPLQTFSQRVGRQNAPPSNERATLHRIISGAGNFSAGALWGRSRLATTMGTTPHCGNNSATRPRAPAPVRVSQGNCPDWRTVEWREEFREMRKVIDWLPSNCVTTKEAPQVLCLAGLL